MQIKYQGLESFLAKKTMPLYVLTGQDNYLLNDSLYQIKTQLKKTYDCEEKIFHIQSADGWHQVIEEANHYSLFAATSILTVFYDKKLLDATGKKVLTQYLTTINSRCFIILHAPLLGVKPLSWLANNSHALLVVAYSFTTQEMGQWIKKQFAKYRLSISPQVPELICQYTQGNMLACAQVIEKISLCHPEAPMIQPDQVLEHLSNQCDYSLYELIDVCLMGHTDKAIQMLRLAAQNKTEPILVLWLYAQEIRVLLQLLHLTSQPMDYKMACAQLKIWPKKMPLYQASLKRLDSFLLKELLSYCKILDEHIKTNTHFDLWNALEKLALSFCLGNKRGALECVI